MGFSSFLMLHQKFVKEPAYKKCKTFNLSSIYPSYYGKSLETLGCIYVLFLNYALFCSEFNLLLFLDRYLLVRHLSLVRG